MKRLIALLLLALFLLSACASPAAQETKKLQKELQACASLTPAYEEATHLIPTPKLGYHAWGQGGWTDGAFYYQAFVWRHDESNQQENKVTVVKYDLAEKKVVAQSETLPLNHCNDLTYDAKNRRLIAVHNKPNWRTLTFLDPDTLAVLGTQTIEEQIFGMDYDEKNDRYCIGISSAAPTFRELDGDFHSVGKIFSTLTESDSFVRQTVACTADYIFHLYHLPSYIYVYDWAGNFVTKIDFFAKGYEPENLSVVGDTLFVSVNDPNKAGCHIYQLRDFLPAE